MPLPLIPVIIGGAALISAALGAKKGAKAISDIKKARRIADDAHSRGQRALANLEQKRSHVTSEADSYGRILVACRRDIFGRFVRFLEALGQRGSMQAIEALEKVHITPVQIRELKVATIEAHRVATGAVSMIGASAGASAGTTSLIGLLGTASTGTAISSVTGVAATNATLAWLGGGSLAAGGGGMALGTLVLGGITFAPAVLVGGLVLASRGRKALTEAYDYDAKVSTEIAKMNALRDFLDRIIIRIHELTDLVQKLDGRANQALDKLDLKSFDVEDEHYIQTFQHAGILIKALAEVMKTPVLDVNNRLTAQSLDIQARYKKLAE